MNSFVEILIKRNVENNKKLYKVCIAISLILIVLAVIFTKILSICFFLLPIILIYHFRVLKYQIEFEYYYMDGELTVSKITNMSRRKILAIVKDDMIRVIAPIGSAELPKYHEIKMMDCSANDSTTLPYVIVYESKKGIKAMNIQMEEELFDALKRSMPFKVTKY